MAWDAHEHCLAHDGSAYLSDAKQLEAKLTVLPSAGIKKLLKEQFVVPPSVPENITLFVDVRYKFVAQVLHQYGREKHVAKQSADLMSPTSGWAFHASQVLRRCKPVETTAVAKHAPEQVCIRNPAPSIVGKPETEDKGTSGDIPMWWKKLSTGEQDALEPFVAHEKTRHLLAPSCLE